MSDRRDFLQMLLASALVQVAAPAAARAAETPGAETSTSAPVLELASAQTGMQVPPATTAARIVHRQPLPAPFDGLDAAFVEVTIPPGVESRAHRHSGLVLGYVIEGEFRFGTSVEPARTVKAGETFYEPPDAIHTVGASASRNRSVKLLAIVIGKQGAAITTYEQ